MTLYSGGESPAEFVARMRAEHGLPPKCGDAAILGRIARELVDGDAAALTNENDAGPDQARRRTIHPDHPDERAITHEST